MWELENDYKLNAALFETAVRRNKKWCIKRVAATHPRFLREQFMADNGKMLRAAAKQKKMARILPCIGSRAATTLVWEFRGQLNNSQYIMADAYLAYDDFIAPGAKSFDEYTCDEKKAILGRSVYNKNLEALDRIHQYYHDQDRESAAELFTNVVFHHAAIAGFTSILDWLYIKYPNVESWAGEGVWQALLPYNPCGAWLRARTSVQELVLRNVCVFNLKYYRCLPNMAVCLTPELYAAILRVAMVSRDCAVVAHIAANNGRRFVRDLCMANGGEMLRRAGKNKRMARVLLRAGVSRSDYASAGLVWPLA